MYETERDTELLQMVLDRSYEQAGSHLRSIFTPERRIPAEELPRHLQGVQVLTLATVTANAEPRIAPVDGIFYRGRFWFGSSNDSMRFRNIRRRPAVSAGVTRGERFAVIVHGTALEVDMSSPEVAPFVDCLREVYGADWDEWAGTSPYAQILPERMFTFGMPMR